MNQIPFVEDLLSRMTLAQKVGQMTQTERLVISPAEVKTYHIGSVLSGGGSCPDGNQPADWVAMTDEFWKASMEADEEHLAIPILYGVDAIHGNNNVLGATVFPHNIGLGAANDPELIGRIAEITAREILATGVDWTFAPTLAVAKDIHWGRTYESYGAKPDYASRFAGIFVEKMQQALGEDGVIACAKHWVGDGGTTHGIDQGETTLSLAELEAEHVAPYLAALEAGVQSVMVSFNSWNGDKCHGHKFLVTELLKEQLGFEGLVISDWDGIDYLADEYIDAVDLSVNAGIDLFMVSAQWQDFISHVLTLVESGKISMERIDDAVRRILNVKYRFGLFDKPLPSLRKWSDSETFGKQAHRDVAREAVQKSLVVLKNEGNILPLDLSADSGQKILLAGKFADDPGAQCGGFTIAWQGQTGPGSVPGATSVWEALQSVAPCDQIFLDPDGTTANPAEHDVAIVVIGEYPYAEGMGDIRESDNVLVEAGSQIKGAVKVLEPYGRTLNLAERHPEDLAVIERIAAAGVAVIAVLISGRPLIIDAELRASSALVAAWLPGSEGGGITDILFGQAKPSGRLSIGWPGIEGQQFPPGYGLVFNMV